VTAIALVIAGLRSDTALVRQCGAAVLALTVAKLFLFDLQRVDAIWRVITFLAFGGILLGLGYAFPTLWRDRRAEGAPEATDRSA
jgi:uncharacterized membrane protein